MHIVHTNSAGRRRLALLLIALVTILADAFGQVVKPGLPLVKNFSTLDYKAGIQNWDITQDKRGLVYIANNFGLLEYDGSEWAIYPVKNGTKVRSVACDSRGRLYVGCQGDFGYFFPDMKGQLQYVSLADSLPPADRDFDETWSVYVDQDKVYFCTFSNIYVYSQGTFSIVRATNGIDHSYLINRRLFVNQPLYGLGIVEGNKIVLVPGAEVFSGMSISTVLPLHEGHLLIATFQHGIYEYKDGKVTEWRPELQAHFRQSIVNCMVRLRNGNFAIGTQNNGLLVTDAHGNEVLRLSRERGIENRTVLSIYEDDLNNLWVGQNNGIAYVETGSPFTFINEQIGLPGSGYSALLDNNVLYLGTNTGVYRQDAAGTYELVDGTRGQAYSLGRYNGDLLVGHHNGALRIDGSRAVQISEVPGAWTFLPLGEHPSKLLGGHYAGLQVFELVDGHWSAGQKLPGFGESSRVMAQGQNGDIWITHGYKGAFRIRLNDDANAIKSVSYYGEDKGFPTNLLINVFTVRNELVFTSQRGLYRYDTLRDRFVPHDFLNRYLGEDNIVWFLREDALGNIYFMSRDHIGLLKKNAVGEYVMETDMFGKLRKFLNDDLQNISVLSNNEVLYGAKDGFILYDPFQGVPQRQPFHVWIRKVANDSLVFAGNYSEGDSVTNIQTENFRYTFPYEANSLSFTFAANSFESGDDIRYQFYLENYDPDWLPWTGQRQKEYTNLKEGSYVFHVRAENVKGEVSDESTYAFTIAPPWYRSVWAYFVYGLSFLCVVFAGFSVLDRKYQKEQARLKEKQREELDHKETQLEKLSRQSQEEINRLQREKLESELQHMNNELATSTMHLLNKNEFITSIKGSLGSLIKRARQDELKKELQQITRQIEQNISADDDWTHFQLHFDRVHGDFSKRFKAAFPNLSPQEIKLSAYLRMNLSTKEIAQLLNISVRGVEISRYRLRKKLQLPRGKNLQEYVLGF